MRRYSAFFSRKLREKFHEVKCQTDTIKARELLVTEEKFGPSQAFCSPVPVGSPQICESLTFLTSRKYGF